MSVAIISMETSVLTKREWDCVKLSMCGKTAKEIAKTLQISYRTVEMHLMQARHKFNSKNKIELFYKINATSVSSSQNAV
jgi:DNA-binding CsgD family transcriptional regulator